MSVIKQLLLAVSGIIVMFSCSRNSSPASNNYLMNEYVVGKISVLHSKEEKLSGVITTLSLENNLSFIYGFDINFDCSELKIDSIVYFKLRSFNGILLATNLTKEKPKANEIFNGKLKDNFLIGNLNLSRRYYNHINQKSCITIREFHTKYHFYNAYPNELGNFIKTTWGFNGETTLYMNRNIYNSISEVLKNTSIIGNNINSFEGWYLMHDNTYIYDISLTHDH